MGKLRHRGTKHFSQGHIGSGGAHSLILKIWCLSALCFYCSCSGVTIIITTFFWEQTFIPDLGQPLLNLGSCLNFTTALYLALFLQSSLLQHSVLNLMILYSPMLPFIVKSTCKEKKKSTIAKTTWVRTPSASLVYFCILSSCAYSCVFRVWLQVNTLFKI